MPASAKKKKQQGEHDLSDSSREGWTAPSFQRSASCTAPAAGDEATRRREGPAETAPPAPSALEEQLIAAVGSNPPPPSSSSPPSHSPRPHSLPTPERSAREAFTTHAGHGELFVQLAQGFPFFFPFVSAPFVFARLRFSRSLSIDRWPPFLVVQRYNSGKTARIEQRCVCVCV